MKPMVTGKQLREALARTLTKAGPATVLGVDGHVINLGDSKDFRRGHQVWTHNMSDAERDLYVLLRSHVEEIAAALDQEFPPEFAPFLVAAHGYTYHHGVTEEDFQRLRCFKLPGAA